MSEPRLSASLYQRFLACPKNAALSIDPEAKELGRPTLRAALGLVSHSLVESSVRIPQGWSAEQINEWFKTNWDTFVEKQFTELTRKWAPNKVPNPEKWPGYFATRASAKTLVVKNSGLLPPKSPSLSNLDNELKEEKVFRFPLVEKFLVSDDLGILGKPDFVFLENNKATIVDYKFGNNQEELEKHKIQMYFYQLLVESVLQKEVDRLAIVASANKVWEIPIDYGEIKKLKMDIPRVLEALKNKRVAAVPSLENCIFCNYKSICDPFKSANIQVSPGRPMAISGPVTHVRRIDDEFQEILIGTKDKSSDDGIKVFGVPNGHTIKVGDEIFLSDKLDFKDTKIVGFSWNSRIFIYS